MALGQGATGGPQMGFPWRTVRVMSVHGNTALCRDPAGTTYTLRADYRRGNGPLPRVGEEWVIDRSLGNWTFSTAVLSKPPVVTGSHDDIPALVNLLAALDEMGLIEDRTTGTRIRADSNHGSHHSH